MTLTVLIKQEQLLSHCSVADSRQLYTLCLTVARDLTHSDVTNIVA